MRIDRLRFGRALVAAAACAAATATAAPPDDAGWAAGWAALGRGGIVLIRHATAPGIGDPPGFRLGDCATQRNLDTAGRAEAVRIGAAFRAHGVSIGRVWSSRWCRTHETAELAFPGQVDDAPAFDSFFDDPATAPARTAAARALLAAWRGPGTLVVVTHQVDITALTGVNPAPGEGVVVKVDGDRVEVVGRIAAAP